MRAATFLEALANNMIILFLGALLLAAALRRSRRGGRSRPTEHGHEQYGHRRAAGSERAGPVAPRREQCAMLAGLACSFGMRREDR